MKKSVLASLTISSAMALSAATATAETNPFNAEGLSSGYQLADGHKGAEGKCGEGKCGGKDKEAKCGEGKCGGDKDKEAKCGEGKCGGEKDKEAKCGEGKCGGSA